VIAHGVICGVGSCFLRSLSLESTMGSDTSDVPQGLRPFFLFSDNRD